MCCVYMQYLTHLIQMHMYLKYDPPFYLAHMLMYTPYSLT